MKHVLLFLSLFASLALAGANDQVAYIITGSGGAPIVTAYNASDSQSKVVTLTRRVVEICVYNGTAAAVYVNWSTGTGSSAPSDDDMALAPATGRCSQPPTTPIQGAVYLRSASGSTITSGSVYVDVTYKP